MTYNEKKTLYESIMKDVAKYVKNILNDVYHSSKISKLIKLAKEKSNTYKNPKDYLVLLGYHFEDISYIGGMFGSVDISYFKDGILQPVDSDFKPLYDNILNYISTLKDDEVITDIIKGYNKEILKKYKYEQVLICGKSSAFQFADPAKTPINYVLIVNPSEIDYILVFKNYNSIYNTIYNQRNNKDDDNELFSHHQGRHFNSKDKSKF